MLRVGGMPAGFAEALATKYGILRLQAQAQANALDSASNLDRVKADLLPGQTRADIGRTEAETANLNLTGRTILPESRARVGLVTGQTRNFGAQADNTDEQTVGLRQMNRKFFRFGMNGLFGN